jgi:hypothetical protein
MREVSGARGLKKMLLKPVLWFTARQEMLFPDTGRNIPFTLTQRSIHRNGIEMMEFVRTFEFPHRTRRFAASMYFHEPTGRILDHLGARSHLQVELLARVEQTRFVMTSGRQFIFLGPLRLPLPHWLCGHAEVVEWQINSTTLGIRVNITNPLLGQIFFYEGTFEQSLH